MTATCSCHKQCAGGDKCGCNGAVPHELHICRNPRCPCHTATYRMELTHDEAGREYYVPQGARLVRKVKAVAA